jgi:hypothetical protein
MATITTVQGTNTPNEGRLIWNTNFTNVNAELIANTAAIAGIGGTPVGTTQVQTLTNKTIVSNYITGGTGNYITLSRRDLNPGNTLFNVASDSGSVTNIDVSQVSVYNLTILGGNGITTSVGSNILYIKNAANCIMNEASQKLGVAVASVSSGNVAQFGGSVLVDGFLAAGADHTAAGSAEVHLSSSSPELRIQTSGNEAVLTFYKSTDLFALNSNFATPGAHYFDISYDGTSLTRMTNSLVTITRSTSMTGALNTFTGDVTVQGTLTASTLVATSTDISVPNGPVHITGDTSTIAAGALAHNYLASMSPGYVLLGNGSSIATATAMTGDVTISSGGVTAIGSDKVTLAMLKGSAVADNTILGGNTSSIVALTSDSNGDVTFVRTSGSLTFSIKAGSIVDADISEFAEIDIEKTTLATVSGITYTGGVLGLTHPISAVNPVGTIIAYAGGSPTETGLQEVVPGYLFCNGATLTSDVKYATLKLVLSGSVLPDLRGEFLRGLAFNATQDPGFGIRTAGWTGDTNGVGSKQSYDIQSHRHTITQGSIETTGARDANGYPVLDGSQLTPLTAPDAISYTGGDETRPKNVYVCYLIKY